MSTKTPSSTGESLSPDAPYPPIRQMRSSLSSSPHYSAGYPIRNNPFVQGVTSNRDEMIVRSSTSSIAGSSEATRSRPGSGITSGISRPSHPSLVQFCPSTHEIYASINCAAPIEDVSQIEDPVPALASPTGRLKKLGPVLLELRRLRLNTDFDQRQQGHLFSSSVVAVSRGKAQLGTSVASTCLSYQPSTTSLSSESRLNPCATGLTTGALCVHTFSSQEEGDDSKISSTVEYFAPRHHRPASSVAWRPRELSHVAIGLMGSGTGSMAAAGVAGRRVGGSRSGSGGDRDFCCLLWDVESQSHSSQSMKGASVAGPLLRLSHNSGVASLAWLLGGQTLAVGCQSRYLQLYDLRVTGSSAPPISAWAHMESVNGIEMDPHRTHVFATFSKSPGEPVKLWDARKMESSLAEIKIQSQEATPSSFSASVADTSAIPFAVKWSNLYPGKLSIALNDKIQTFDTITSGSRPVLTTTIHAGGPILDFALHPLNEAAPLGSEAAASKQGGTDDPNSQPSHPSMQVLLSELHQHRMLVVLSDRTVRDMPKRTTAPLAVSRRDGCLAHSLGRTIWIDSSSESPMSMNMSRTRQGEDISATMMRRARCSHAYRYSMDASLNIKMLLEEQRSMNAEFDDEDASHVTRNALVQVWKWILRVDILCRNSDKLSHFHDENVWPAKSIIDSGAWQLLQTEPNSDPTGDGLSDSVSYSETLFRNTYDSGARRAVLASCGWKSDSDSLSDIIADCTSEGEYERAAALAVWHDDISAAIEALHHGADSVRLRLRRSTTEDPDSRNYREMLRLFSMCIAGYQGSNPKLPASRMWRTECSSLLGRPELSDDKKKNDPAAYLHALLLFFLDSDSETGLESVLHEEGICLSDRVAFSCRFLDRRSLKKYLLDMLRTCRDSGNLEGLIIGGLEKQGFAVLSSYVDKYTDVQTAALVCSRVLFPSDSKWERAIGSEWVELYRSLLNTWQMWQSRAMFDVDRAEFLRKLRAKPSFAGTSIPPQVAASAQIEARCNYCSMPLSGLRRQEAGTANQWLSKLSKMKPVLSCCPRCRKPLPRCSICLLPLGCLNPYIELAKERKNANLPVAEWFTWCMRCKHGGHAHHLVGWFTNHEVCPVSGCECRCQFDGIQKISRIQNTEAAATSK